MDIHEIATELAKLRCEQHPNNPTPTVNMFNISGVDAYGNIGINIQSHYVCCSHFGKMLNDRFNVLATPVKHSPK